jgi:hypothetical protein
MKKINSKFLLASLKFFNFIMLANCGKGNKNIGALYLNWDLSQNERASGLEQFLSSAPLPQSVI